VSPRYDILQAGLHSGGQHFVRNQMDLLAIQITIDISVTRVVSLPASGRRGISIYLGPSHEVHSASQVHIEVESHDILIETSTVCKTSTVTSQKATFSVGLLYLVEILETRGIGISPPVYLLQHKSDRHELVKWIEDREVTWSCLWIVVNRVSWLTPSSRKNIIACFQPLIPLPSAMIRV
jgi:hypothetical protein